MAPLRPGAPRARVAATACAIGAASLLLSWAITRLPATGVVSGAAILSDTQAPARDARVWLSPVGEDYTTAKETRTDGQGRFLLKDVPEGVWHLHAVSQHHECGRYEISVREGRSTHAVLALARNTPEIDVQAMASVLTPDENVSLALRGYARYRRGDPEPVSMVVARIRADELQRTGSGSAALDTALNGWSLESVRGQITRFSDPVARRTVAIGRADWDGFFETRASLGRMPLGAYLVTVSYGNVHAAAVFHVTDLALVVKSDDRRLVSLVTDLVTGQARAGVRVSIPAAGVSASSGADGLVEMPVPRGLSAGVLVAAQGDSFASAAHYFDQEGGEPTRIFTYTDRPVYRPGQMAHFKGIVRREERGAYEVPVSSPVTVRVEDPQGVVLLRKALTTSRHGSFNGSFLINRESPTGYGTIFVETGGRRDAASFEIASYRKPEFEVDVKPARSALIAGEHAEFQVTGSYYYGAPLCGAPVRYNVYWSPKWNWEDDDDEEADWDRPTWGGEYDYDRLHQSGTAVLDGSGRAKITFAAAPPTGGSAPQAHVVTVYATVQDPAGRLVDSEARATVYAGAVRVAIEPDRSVVEPLRRSRFVVRAYDLSGRPAAGVRISVSFDRERADGRSTLLPPLGRAEVVTNASGEAEALFAPPGPGELRVTAECRDGAGRSISERTSIWVVRDRGGDVATDYPHIGLHADRRRYARGDTARLLLNSSCVGATALITLEGAHLTRAWTVPIRTRSTIVPIVLDPSMGPNVLVSAGCVYRKRYESSEANLHVAVPERDIDVMITPDRAVHRPGSTARLRITTRDHRGKPVSAETSLAIVDESVYAIREDRPRALVDAFYPEAAWSRVRTSDSCRSQLLDAEGAGDKGTKHVLVRSRFKDTAVWMPRVVTDARGIADVVARLPDNLTTWRATAYAHTRATQLGYGRAGIVATLPFHVRADMPRFLTVGDSATVVGVVRNGTGQAVSTEAVLVPVGPGLEVEGDTVRSLSVAPLSSMSATWRVRATRGGVARVRMGARASAAGLADAVAGPLEIRPRAREVMVTSSGRLDGRVSMRFDVPSGAVGVPAKVTVRVTPSILATLGPALEYLVEYPWGCTEQTVSSFLPDLLVARLQRHADPSTASQVRASIGGAALRDVPNMVRAGITRLRAMMGYGWAWWRHDPPDAWLTAYATLALGAALADGYELPSEMRDSAVHACEQLMRKADPDTAAMACYALALHGKDVRSRLRANAMHAPGWACLVMADAALRAHSPQGDAAYGLLRTMAVRSGSEVYWQAPPGVAQERFSDAMATALAISALLTRDPGAPEVAGGLQYLMHLRTDDCWVSTRDTSFVLMALCGYLQAHPSRSVPVRNVTVRVNGRVARVIGITDDVAHREHIVRFRTADLHQGANEIALEATKSSKPWYALAVVTFDATQVGRPAVSPSGLRIRREYEVIQKGAYPSGRGGPPGRPLSGPVPPGSPVRVRLTVTALRDTRFVIVTDPLPAGLEPDYRGEDPDEEWHEWYSALDVRDDRVAVFARNLTPGNHVIEYIVRAQRPGRYTAMPARVECMYAPETRAETAARTIEVR